MMGSRIKQIEYYLPKNVLTNEQLEKEIPGWTAEKIENKIGIKQRHICDPNETALDLGYNAAKKVFDSEAVKKEDIDFLLFCTESPDYYLPPNATILQDKLGLRTNIGALDYNLGCSGFIYGLALASSLIQSKIAKKLLLITSETYSKHIHPKDKSNKTIFGDAAAAIVIEESPDNQILNFTLGTNGEGAKNLIVPQGGLRNRFNPNESDLTDESGSTRTKNNLYMNGPEIFNFTIDIVPELVNNVLEANKVSFDDIDYVILHQANKYILNYLRKKIGIPKEKFYMNMEDTGNTVSSTIPIRIKTCLENQTIKAGDKVLLIGFGVGYSWGGTIVIV
jgi:3-oxoacyl-[acyl-carrier-protein] synthase-3